MRLIINLAFFVVSLQQKNKAIFSFGEDLPNFPPNQPNLPNPPSNPSTPPIRQFSFWNRHTYTNHNYSSYARPKWYYVGNLTLGTCTLLLGCVGAYVGYQMWQTTLDSNNALDRNSKAMERQSDRVDVDAGRLKPEDYIAKWIDKK